jgi:hypothetical protein
MEPESAISIATQAAKLFMPYLSRCGFSIGDIDKLELLSISPAGAYVALGSTPYSGTSTFISGHLDTNPDAGMMVVLILRPGEIPEIEIGNSDEDCPKNIQLLGISNISRHDHHS